MKSTKKAYKEFLQSLFWINLSDACKARAGRVCEQCGWDRRLEAHHKVYRAEWTDTKLEDLICLCATCHQRAHGITLPVPKRKKVRWHKRKKPTRAKRRRGVRSGNFVKRMGHIIYAPI